MKLAFLKITLIVAGAISALNSPAADTPTAPTTLPSLPGKGAAQHPFLYAGEWDTRKPQAQSIFIVREGKVVEYDLDGNALWSVPAKSPWHAVRLKNGNTLIAGDWSRYAREVNPKGDTVWEFTQTDVPAYILGNIQTAHRLANGNTVMCCWIAGDNDTSHWPGTVQMFEAAPDKSIVWALSSWQDPDLGPATHIQLLDEPDALEDSPH